MFMTKIRTIIPANLAADVMFASDNTCCMCRERGKALQIHHIDENPSNSVFGNLSVLCLECHNDTQVKGGFGRKLNDILVVKYRDEWLETVKRRRNLADEMALKRHVGGIEQKVHITEREEEPPREAPLSYVNSLPAFKAELLKHAQPEWDSGVTARMVQASYNYIDALQGILVTLSGYYSAKQFAGKTPQEFFSELIASRFEWHRAHAEPHGPGTGGTIVNVVCSGNVMADVERMVEDMVMSLVGHNDEFDWKGWPPRWRGKSSNNSLNTDGLALAR